MPAAVERCVESLLSKWNKDPSSRPAPREKNQDAKSQAWAICQAAHKKSVANSLEIMLEGGYGPALIGAAATNRPYIPKLQETEIVGEEGARKLRVHLANAGHFQHPSGPFTLNRAVFQTMIANLEQDVVGNKVAYDNRHKPQLGALGWFESLEMDAEGKRLYGIVDPTKVGLEMIEDRQYLYSSMEFHRNFERDDVVLDLEHATDDVCLIDLEMDNEHKTEEDDMPDTEELEQERNDLKLKLDDAEAKLKAAEDAMKKAEERSLKLEREATASKIEAIVAFVQSHRDGEGRAHPTQLSEWVGKVLRFEKFGDGEAVVRLESEDRPNLAVMNYLIGAIKELVTAMPGAVPLERITQDGKRQEGGDDEDDFDYAEEWA